ncbi:hypothetical protein PC118_g21904 [Phytophthora cactorum]|uniref:Uncharacterized protein n=1 Tax=Phytophthora cactorum TaxID=29920 RepID=A0A8T1F4D0_9STRA|nr:hypothetical protein PC111_g21598 [Phytophthora cactorum]KAG2797080.1 hypothetical protein PC112_g21940 [Phytophthora cactorum]KAG2961568.1 hypothetical protein PC118_g21904 [Phytophthora cactorum]
MARGKRLSDGKRAMIVNAYKFFLKGRQEDGRVGGRTRELVHQCLGTPTSTVALIWRAYKTREGADTSEAQVAEERRGRPRSYEDEDIVPAVHNYVNKCNKDRQPIIAQSVSAEVERLTSIKIHQ